MLFKLGRGGYEWGRSPEKVNSAKVAFGDEGGIGDPRGRSVRNRLVGVVNVPGGEVGVGVKDNVHQLRAIIRVGVPPSGYNMNILWK